MDCRYEKNFFSIEQVTKVTNQNNKTHLKKVNLLKEEFRNDLNKLLNSYKEEKKHYTIIHSLFRKTIAKI